MKKFVPFTSKVMPLPLKDVDTDLILPAQFLTNISRDGFGENLFRRLRDAEPDFPMNQPRFKDAQILVADSNFGCGSSREHAVWALQGAGFRAVISKSFADIFSSNSGKNGLLLVTLPEEIVERILAGAKAGDYEAAIDLESQTVTLPGGEQAKFEFDPFRKHCLLNGLDDIDYILSRRDEIVEYRRKQDEVRFFDTRF